MLRVSGRLVDSSGAPSRSGVRPLTLIGYGLLNAVLVFLTIVLVVAIDAGIRAGGLPTGSGAQSRPWEEFAYGVAFLLAGFYLAVPIVIAFTAALAFLPHPRAVAVSVPALLGVSIAVLILRTDGNQTAALYFAIMGIAAGLALRLPPSARSLSLPGKWPIHARGWSTGAGILFGLVAFLMLPFALLRPPSPDLLENVPLLAVPMAFLGVFLMSGRATERGLIVGFLFGCFSTLTFLVSYLRSGLTLESLAVLLLWIASLITLKSLVDLRRVVPRASR